MRHGADDEIRAIRAAEGRVKWIAAIYGTTSSYVSKNYSTKKADNEWVKPGHGQDHLFDCEAMHMVLAQMAAINLTGGVTDEQA